MFKFRRLLVLYNRRRNLLHCFPAFLKKVIDICPKPGIINVNGICHKLKGGVTDARKRQSRPDGRGEKMPRPRKWRRVCCLPKNAQFGPMGGTGDSEDLVIMQVDEYETIRLIDLEGLTQEECAGRMNVARTTVQGIYDSARKKLADSLVRGKGLLIEGGEYILCGGLEETCGCGGRHRHRCGGKRNCENDIESGENLNEDCSNV